jgi:hypothetical protein
VSQFHPDVNPSLNAHSILTEINEAYEILSNPAAKQTYDRFLTQKEVKEAVYTENFFQNTDRKRRRGKTETAEEREKKRVYSLKRNKRFNKKMKYFSVVSLVFASTIFIDYYLPCVQQCQKVYVAFKTSQENIQNRDLVSLFLPKGRKIEVYPIEFNSQELTVPCSETVFNNTPIYHVLQTVQLGKVVYKPIESLFDVMLIYGMVCLSSMYVLSYKLEASMVTPGVLTFFNNILVFAFIVLWLAE